MPYTPDPWYKSKRNFAAIILVISNLTYLLFGLEITPETQSTIVENLVIIGNSVGILLVVWSKIMEKLKTDDDK